MGKRDPIRTCIGCQVRKSKALLIRLVLDEVGNVVIDLTGKAVGRGAYLCRAESCVPEKECINKALMKHSLSKVFKREIKTKSVEGFQIKYGEKTKCEKSIKNTPAHCHPHGPC